MNGSRSAEVVVGSSRVRLMGIAGHTMEFLLGLLSPSLPPGLASPTAPQHAQDGPEPVSRTGAQPSARDPHQARACPTANVVPPVAQPSLILAVELVPPPSPRPAPSPAQASPQWGTHSPENHEKNVHDLPAAPTSATRRRQWDGTRPQASSSPCPCLTERARAPVAVRRGR